MSLLPRLALPLVLVASTWAQGPEEPHAAIAHLAPYAGSYEGSGTLRRAADAPEVPWEASWSLAVVLGGHAYQGRMDGQVGGEGGPAFARESLLAYDPDRRSLYELVVDLRGLGQQNRAAWSGRHTLVTSAHFVFEGELVRERATTIYGKDGFDLLVERTSGHGQPFEYVRGTFRRVEAGGEPAERNSAEAAKATGLIAPLAGLVGHWTSQGWMLPAPGAPKVGLTGSQTYEAILDGQVLREHVTGQAEGWPAAYEAISYIYYDGYGQCFRHFGATNNGVVASSQAWVLPSGAIAFVDSGPRMGQPMAARNLIEWDEHGPVCFVTDTICADGAPLRTFELVYDR